ncbi:MAG: hypothetical protein KJO41_06820 [Bacteroidia bacterium]|nr:hypothetical protein [Bacteroidia bacterium]NND25845.1 hypothetical protein [Flavobacteriaceae bacterium]NNK60962.1 hypothetical protein [Flavobacteriaceae bacterium]NNL31619.1 hypothetical protein [Flavobacteriaceae bacterium]RZW44509.1 MAG: hypothetical protein EX263_10720 [Flavobacteriaceae bacterium]
MIKSLNYVFGKVEVYDYYMIVTMNAGIHISPEHNNILEDLVLTYYYDKPFVYLTHRKNSYSVDPVIYFETDKIENMVGFGVIAEVPVSGGNAEIEKLFLNKPFKIFLNRDEAVHWAKQRIEDELKRS